MATIHNKALRPLSIPLSGGKTLFLGPGKSAEVASNATSGPGFQKLLAAGDIEISDETHRATGGAGRSSRARPGMIGHSSGSGIRRSGDR